MTNKLIERFVGPAGRPALEEALLQQKLILGNEKLAALLAEQGSLQEMNAEEVLIKEGNQDNEVYFIITGNFKIKVHDREIANRGAGEHVGEMAALVNTETRSATVVATELSIVLKVSAEAFKTAANEHPRIWQYVIRQLVERLNQRNELVRPSHESALIFIICSIEALPIAQEIERQFEYDKFFVKIWTEGTFHASQYTLESLENQLDQSDFAIAIAQADDKVLSRGEQQAAPRDNVIFELGMFVGRLGRERSILLEPRGEDVRLPSDLKGLTTITYRPVTGTERPQLGTACSDLREIFNRLGPR